MAISAYNTLLSPPSLLGGFLCDPEEPGILKRIFDYLPFNSLRPLLDTNRSLRGQVIVATECMLKLPGDKNLPTNRQTASQRLCTIREKLFASIPSMLRSVQPSLFDLHLQTFLACSLKDIDSSRPTQLYGLIIDLIETGYLNHAEKLVEKLSPESTLKTVALEALAQSHIKCHHLTKAEEVIKRIGAEAFQFLLFETLVQAFIASNQFGEAHRIIDESFQENTVFRRCLLQQIDEARDQQSKLAASPNQKKRKFSSA